MNMLVSARFILGMPFRGDAADTNLAGGGFAITGSRPRGTRDRAARHSGGAACRSAATPPPGTNLAGSGFAITGSRPHGARGRAARLGGGAACRSMSKLARKTGKRSELSTREHVFLNKPHG